MRDESDGRGLAARRAFVLPFAFILSPDHAAGSVLTQVMVWLAIMA